MTVRLPHLVPVRVSYPSRLMVALGLTLGLGGCADPLFPESRDSTQFAGYNRARDQTVPLYVDDAYGRRRPNLRGRLLMQD